MTRKKLSEINPNQPFGCCAWHHICEMGKKPCVHAEGIGVEKDPAYARLCTVFQNQGKNRISETTKECPIEKCNLISQGEQEECVLKEGEGGQYSLF
ncbi:hypothetical protein AM501_09880 [Aneurinibacillus migulanus]|uniref:hypothetical protein n=1 Tax=Aneurinibacillus migulanus TaxID=47500 RepID=UPI0005BDF6CA|nr:hypothetical protein [Aneurinibacillus migulanus]KIV56453.1 hypothetical protein TS64_09295 [Aneurinibacillus migulanus]KPD08461.1 hypothetical protein AM501_09880 [Aneurinibacillus migulanus]